MHDAIHNAQSLQVLIAGKLYAPEEIPGPVAVVLEGTTIRALWRNTDAASARHRLAEQMPQASIEVTDLGSWSLAPGYVDLHTHGFYGYDMTTGSQEDVESMAYELPRTGVTSFFPTIATLGRAETEQQVRRVTAAAEKQLQLSAAEILGLRLEGPFICRAKKGAQYEPGIRTPDAAEMEKLAAISHGWIRIVDYAPEEDENERFLTAVVQLGILACIGHTSATYEQTLSAIDGGARHSTHLFNAMSPLKHRAPGVAGALLTDHRATIEIIADGIHMHPAIIKLVLAARSFRDVALITDAVAAAGLPEGEYEFVGRKVTVHDGAVRLASGSLAGSILTLDCAVRNIVKFCGLGWSEAISMATLVPATIAGIAQRKGKIAPGADADLLALDEHGFVQRTWVRGLLAYQEAPANNGAIAAAPLTKKGTL
ncbi:MAG TPA: N-acetylglucosamine-6-phosphate deacetylase [Ktedonobacteraceae bacterium]|nr:N-acetylglucosamine-6-phosphate deacetylase [Ktedonobacteraceae bacterium]